MYVKKTEKGTFIYPTTTETRYHAKLLPYSHTVFPYVSVTQRDNKVTMLHASRKDGEPWNLVQFSSLTKEQLQEYINELQKVCDKLED